MKNHEKSWKIMKNHDFLCWTAIAKQLPGGLQKTKKTEKSPQNVPKSSWNGFSTPQNLLEWLRYPPGLFNNVFAYFFLIFSWFFMFFHDFFMFFKDFFFFTLHMQHVTAPKAIIVDFLRSDTQKHIFSIGYNVFKQRTVFL